MVQSKLLSIALSVSVGALGCVGDDLAEPPPRQVQDGDTSTSAEDNDDGTPEPGAEELGQHELVAAIWPDDVDGVDIFLDDERLVITVLNAGGDPIARVVAQEHAPGTVDVSTDFADGASWATVDIGNEALMQHGLEGIDAGQLHDRIKTIMLEVQAPLQEGPWLDCVLAVLDAVVSCIPAVGVLVLCPQKIKTAACKCLKAAKKKACAMRG